MRIAQNNKITSLLMIMLVVALVGCVGIDPTYQPPIHSPQTRADSFAGLAHQDIDGVALKTYLTHSSLRVLSNVKAIEACIDDRQMTGVSEVVNDYKLASGISTGFFISEDGYVMTAAHSIRAPSVVCIFEDDQGKKEIRNARIVWCACPADALTLPDIAIVHIDHLTNTRPLHWCDDDACKPDAPVIGIGMGQGDFDECQIPYFREISIYAGHLESMTTSDIPSWPGMDVMQVCARIPVNDGDSGGPVILENGELVGFISRKKFKYPQYLWPGIKIAEAFSKGCILIRPRQAWVERLLEIDRAEQHAHANAH